MRDTAEDILSPAAAACAAFIAEHFSDPVFLAQRICAEDPRVSMAELMERIADEIDARPGEGARRPELAPQYRQHAEYLRGWAWRPSDCIGNIFTREEFEQDVKDGSLMDDDGWGYAARLRGTPEALAAYAAIEDKQWQSFEHCKRLKIEVDESRVVHPSDITDDLDRPVKWPKDATHVVWINR